MSGTSRSLIQQLKYEILKYLIEYKILSPPITHSPFSPGEEEQGSMAEVSYYSYEYDPDSEPFLADADGGDHLDLLEGGRDIEQKALLVTDLQLRSLDTKNIPERWYELLSSICML